MRRPRSVIVVAIVIGFASVGVRWIGADNAAAVMILGGAAALVGYQAFQWWTRAGVESQTKLLGAEPVPLTLEHPFLDVRAMVTEAGRVTILVEGVAGDLSITSRQGVGLGGIEQRTGDAGFDARVVVTGNVLTCRSLLDGGTRDAILEAFDAFPGITVNNGVLQWSGRPISTQDAAERLLDVAGRLLAPDRLAGLEKSALTDRLPAMRLRALELLMSRFSKTPETRRTALAALADADPGVRLKVAVFLGPEGHDELVALAGNESLPPNLRAEAIRGVTQLPRERAAPVVREALADRRELVRLAAIRAVGQLRLPSCNNRLAGIVRRAPPAQQLAIVEAAAATQHESAEGPLLAAIEGGTPEVKLAAVRALGPIGTVHAIEPLLALRGVGLLAGEIGPAAGAAVAAIQSRLAGAGAGQLALAETSGGAMSFPNAESGSLSVPPNEPGGLALSQDEVDGIRREVATRRRTT